ncbi:universal stress protein [Halostella sp. PRR32]|uniref:universal stress protein n=1 Tax=Halostella sp. PRR32 TaxID=3098147 RepID=UPI002B1E07F4|nr:universal stress protein [Halostella sp. PRR32]
MYDTILVPTDGSEHAVRACEHGLALSRRFDATVHLLNVIDVTAAGGIFDAGGVSREFVERLEEEGSNAIETVEAVAEETDSIHTEIIEGKPSEAILEYVDENGIDLLSMGTHGRSGINRYITGSVTERVVRLSDVPVLTVRATEQNTPAGSYDEILVPTDGSEPATAAMDHGIAIAQEAGARIHAVNVVDVSSLAANPNVTPPTELLDQFRSQGESATEAIATRAREAGLDAVTSVREGIPSSDLLQYARENEIDLIAMGTHGRTGLERYVLGSTTERIVRESEIPVLSVSPQQSKD